MSQAERASLASRLLTMAAKQSVKSQFGWAHPDCALLQDAARVLLEVPDVVQNGREIGVLSQKVPQRVVRKSKP